ncbi:MAG TPA: hypothetical protein DCG06_01565 [Deltaproteobacteria bacterium]|nr:hypothetical protein [Deltaproteobacteria bacterium]
MCRIIDIFQSPISSILGFETSALLYPWPQAVKKIAHSLAFARTAFFGPPTEGDRAMNHARSNCRDLGIAPNRKCQM